MQIKIFKGYDHENLTTKVNEFIQDKKAVSTQLSMIPAPNGQYTQFVILVQYEN